MARIREIKFVLDCDQLIHYLDNVRITVDGMDTGLSTHNLAQCGWSCKFKKNNLPNSALYITFKSPSGKSNISATIQYSEWTKLSEFAKLINSFAKGEDSYQSLKCIDFAAAVFDHIEKFSCNINITSERCVFSNKPAVVKTLQSYSDIELLEELSKRQEAKLKKPLGYYDDRGNRIDPNNRSEAEVINIENFMASIDKRIKVKRLG